MCSNAQKAEHLKELVLEVRQLLALRRAAKARTAQAKAPAAAAPGNAKAA